MTAKVIYHQSHGDYLHDISIFITELIVLERGYKFLNGDTFKSKQMYPGEPDVYFELPIERTDAQGRKTKTVGRRVIEIETNATKDSIKKKKAQFISSIMRADPYIDMIIIPLNKMPMTSDARNWQDLKDYIDRFIP